MLDELIARLTDLPGPERARAIEVAERATSGMRFMPLPGPQTDAYLSEADVLLFGGSAGSSKSALLVGLAVNEHDRSIIFRRESSQTDGLEAFAKEVLGNDANFNGADNVFTWEGGRKSLKLAGMKEADDWRKHAGRERDLIGYDEGLEFLEGQVRSMLAWLRAEPGKRCRMVLASNPPRDSDGAWVFQWFGPWLTLNHPHRAAPGELRWACFNGDEIVWVDGPGEWEINGEMVFSMSFTFIPASLRDNPYRNTPEYRARLQSLPEPLRSQLLYGDFGAGAEDDEWQCIPTDWVKAAQQRWSPVPPVGIPLCAIGVDVAQGGGDETVLARRHDGWYAPILVTPGRLTPGGTDVAALVLKHRHDGAKIIIDVGGGWGADAHGHLVRNNVDSVPYMGVKESLERTENKLHRFTNIRSMVHWRFREALDPDQRGGSKIMLPDDRELLADLVAPRYRIVKGGIEVEAKVAVVKRLGRSTNRGDAVLMAWTDGAKMASHYQDWSNGQGGFGRAPPKVIIARRPLTARH